MGALAAPLVSAAQASTGGVTHPSFNLTMVNVAPLGGGVVSIAVCDEVAPATEPCEVTVLPIAQTNGNVTNSVLKLDTDEQVLASVILNHPRVVALVCTKVNGGGLRGVRDEDGGGDGGGGEDTAEHDEMS